MSSRSSARRPVSALLAATTLVLAAFAAPPQPAVAPLADASTARRLFASPTTDYTSSPLWVWNDLLTEEQIRTALREFAGQGVKQAFVHPRPGLMTPYLSADWFRLWKVSLDEAAKLGYNIYTVEGNVAFAKYLYNKYGSDPWSSSSKCWSDAALARI